MIAMIIFAMIAANAIISEIAEGRIRIATATIWDAGLIATAAQIWIGHSAVPADHKLRLKPRNLINSKKIIDNREKNL